MSWRVMLIVEVMCIPYALIMLVRTHMDIHIGSHGVSPEPGKMQCGQIRLDC